MQATLNPASPFSRTPALLTRPFTLALLVALATFAIYARTVAPSVLPADSGELQFAAWGFWLAHPTGYPLYLLLGGIWQHLLPFGDAAYRLNLFSALWGALAVGVLFAVIWQITRSRGAALIAALTFAVTPLAWAQATRAEVYSFQTFFVALLTLWAILWRKTPSPRYAIAFALTFGLALTHHRTTLLLIPAFLVLLANPLLALKNNLPFALKRAALYVGIAVLPLLLYLYIPLRTPATPYASFNLSPAPPLVIFENSPSGWLANILGTGFASLLRFDASTLPALASLPAQLLAQFNPFALALAVLGLAAFLGQRKYAYAGFVILGFLTSALFNSLYHIGDIADYATLAYFFVTLALGAGIALVLQWGRRLFPQAHSLLPAIVLLGLFALLPLQNFFNNFESLDSSRRFETRDQWTALLDSAIPPNAILLSNDRDDMTPLYYMQFVNGIRPDLLGIFPKITSAIDTVNVLALVNRVAPSNRPIFSIKPIPALSLRYNTVPTGKLWQIDTAPLAAPQVASNATLGSALQIRGYTLFGTPANGQEISIDVQYQVQKPLSRDYAFSLQLFDGNHSKAAQANDHITGAPEYQSSRWQVGETLRDQFTLQLPGSLPAGTYHLVLNAYDPATGDTLSDPAEFGTLQITP